MKAKSITLFLLLFSVAVSAQNIANIWYETKILEPIKGSNLVLDDAKVKISFYKKYFISESTIDPTHSYLVDTRNKIRYRCNEKKQTYKQETIDSTSGGVITEYKDEVESASETVNGYKAVKHHLTFKNEKQKLVYDLNVWVTEDIAIDSRFSPYVIGELFVVKIPFEVEGCIVKATADVSSKGKIISRGQLDIAKSNNTPLSTFFFRKPSERGFKREVGSSKK